MGQPWSVAIQGFLNAIKVIDFARGKLWFIKVKANDTETIYPCL